MKTVIEVLRDTRQHLSNPDNWTQHTYARDPFGKPVRLQDNNAVCFCLQGAVRYNSRENLDRPTDLEIHSMTPIINLIPDTFKNVGAFNDQSTHEEVLGLLDRAIASLE